METHENQVSLIL